MITHRHLQNSHLNTNTQGRPCIPSETMMRFPPCFRFPPYFRKILGLSEFFLQFYLFPKNFIRQKISDDLFLVIDHKFRISPPLFSLFQYISPLFRENYSFPPTFTNSPCFTQIHLLVTYFTCIPPTLTMMHLCITQCTQCTYIYWTPLHPAISRFIMIEMS